MDTAPESQFVRLVMPEASGPEIAEATRRWFNFLRLLDEIAQRIKSEEDATAQTERSGEDNHHHV